MKNRTPWPIALLLVLLAASSMAEPPVFDFGSEATYKQVDWADFKGSGPQLGRWSRASGAQIVTTMRLTKFQAEIVQDEEGGFVARAPGIEAYAVMDKFLSGSERSARKPVVLAHEQLHFDLTEALARELGVELRALEAHGATANQAEVALAQRIRELADARGDELQKLQDTYDEESVHGTREGDQEAWAEIITKRFAEASRRAEASRGEG